MERTSQSELGQSCRVHALGQITELFDRLGDRMVHGVQRLAGGRGSLVGQIGREPQLDGQRQQPLLGAVVQVPFEAHAFLVGGHHQAAPRLAQRLVGRRQFTVVVDRTLHDPQSDHVRLPQVVGDQIEVGAHVGEQHRDVEPLGCHLVEADTIGGVRDQRDRDGDHDRDRHQSLDHAAFEIGRSEDHRPDHVLDHDRQRVGHDEHQREQQVPRTEVGPHDPPLDVTVPELWARHPAERQHQQDAAGERCCPPRLEDHGEHRDAECEHRHGTLIGHVVRDQPCLRLALDLGDLRVGDRLQVDVVVDQHVGLRHVVRRAAGGVGHRGRLDGGRRAPAGRPSPNRHRGGGPISRAPLSTPRGFAGCRCRRSSRTQPTSGSGRCRP